MIGLDDYFLLMEIQNTGYSNINTYTIKLMLKL